MTTHVHKFGGTSVDGPDRLRAAATILKAAAATGETTVGVSSAMSGVTNDLIAIADDAAHARLEPAIRRAEALRARHQDVAAALGATDEDPLPAAIDTLCDELESIIRAAAHLTELTPRASDRLIITGEKLAVRLLARALESLGVPAAPLDADTFLDTDDNFGSAEPVRDVADRETAAAINAVLRAGRIPVITGFCGRAPDGATTTLGRGGSDLSATLVAAALRAEKCTIWTDVPGVFSADPRLVTSPRLLARLHYREAAEMSYYGAKVLHPRTIAPVARLRIPVLVRSSMEPEKPGTIIDATFTPESELVKAVTAIKDQCLVSIEGNGMTGVPGVAARAFRALADRDVSATMISQASSEASICFAIPGAAANTAEEALKGAFRDELSRGLVEEISIREGVGLVAAVGIGMAHHTGVAGRVFSSLGRAGVNILAIAQGSSELNISFAVDQAEVPAAVQAIHDDFVTGIADGGTSGAMATARRGFESASNARTTRPLILLGCGTVGRALLTIAAESLPFAAIADSNAIVTNPETIPPATIQAIVEHKAAGSPLADFPGAQRHSTVSIADIIRSLNLVNPILIDATAGDDHETLFIAALNAGCDVVTANKKPIAADAAHYRALRETARHSARTIRAEATVGAALPVLSTIESLLASADTIHSIEACLSGTLGFLLTEIESGVTLSKAVADAAAKGFTEPDPAADLSGADVARKAIILARVAALAPNDDVRLTLTPFLPDLPAGLARTDLIAHLTTHDEPFARRLSEARTRGHVLRYIATINPHGARVALKEIPADHPLAALHGPDNMIVITTDRYRSPNPLIIRGPGAGPALTAAAILADIHRLL